jgi:hypothetical protein
MVAASLVVGLLMTLSPADRAERFQGALTDGREARIAALEKELVKIEFYRPSIVGNFVTAGVCGALLLGSVVAVTIVAALAPSFFIVAIVLGALVAAVAVVVAIVALALIPVVLSDQRKVDARGDTLREELRRLKEDETAGLLVPLARF